jgi:hypothetical protein
MLYQERQLIILAFKTPFALKVSLSLTDQSETGVLHSWPPLKILKA